MRSIGTAFFVREPCYFSELMVPHLIERERRYETLATVSLPKIEYENFITDMLADRQFIEDNSELCKRGEIWKCIFVHQKGREDGILVMPEDDCFVGWAAYLHETPEHD